MTSGILLSLHLPVYFMYFCAMLEKPHTIGVLMDWYRPGVVDGALGYCGKNNLILDVRWAQRPDWALEQMMGTWNGAIVHLHATTEVRKILDRMKIPIVGVSANGKETVRVYNDFAASAVLIANELERARCRRVYVRKATKNSLPTEWIFARCVSAECQQRGTFEVKEVEMGLDEPEILLRRFGAPRKGSPLAVVSMHAGHLFELQLLLLTSGWRIPDDMVMVTLDKDLQGTAATAPVPITSLNPDYWRRGHLAAELCHGLIRGEKVPAGDRLVAPLGMSRRLSTGNREKSDVYVQRLVKLIENYATDTINVSNLIEKLGVSRRTLEHRFRAEMDCSPLEYMTRKRLENACRLLRETEETLEWIATACGFASGQYLSRVFKKETGMTPGYYRESKRLE